MPMRCRLRWAGQGLVCVVGLLTASASLGQRTAAREGQSAIIVVRLSEPNATLTVDGEKTTSKGKERRFATPPLVPGTRYRYTLVASWPFNDYTMTVRTHVVSFKAGATVTADLRTPQTGRTDELIAEYGPTPPRIVEAMCKLATVGKNDVVYDLGCGDGRIILHTVKKFGARKGVGIDISPAWVKVARKNVKAAGLADKIEIREGDVLKLTDLSKATVVMLTLGEELNKRIRPLLEKTLPPGARIVSYAHRMGDWEPIRTETYPEEDVEHVIHLWRINPR
jgi:uncharacterized protein (TIGR03000 family)